MKLIVCEDYKELSKKAAEIVAESRIMWKNEHKRIFIWNVVIFLLLVLGCCKVAREDYDEFEEIERDSENEK